MLQIAICDDEKIITDELRERLIQYKSDYDIDTYQSGADLLEAKKQYDLIFLDIEMPQLNGMQTAAQLRSRDYDGHIVFLTSHTEFMPEAFKVKAFRFLQKPITDIDFKETMDASEKEIMNNKKIALHIPGGTKLLNIKDIIYFETIRNYTYIYTKQGDIETRKSLREWMDMLGSEHFYQVHKSYAVALRYIEVLDNDGITMKYTSTKIPVSRRKISEVKKAFFAYVKKYALFT